MSKRPGSSSSMRAGSACSQPTRSPVAITFENVPASSTPRPPATAESVGGRSGVKKSSL